MIWSLTLLYPLHVCKMQLVFYRNSNEIYDTERWLFLSPNSSTLTTIENNTMKWKYIIWINGNVIYANIILYDIFHSVYIRSNWRKYEKLRLKCSLSKEPTEQVPWRLLKHSLLQSSTVLLLPEGCCEGSLIT